MLYLSAKYEKKNKFGARNKEGICIQLPNSLVDGEGDVDEGYVFFSMCMKDAETFLKLLNISVTNLLDCSDTLQSGVWLSIEYFHHEALFIVYVPTSFMEHGDDYDSAVVSLNVSQAVCLRTLLHIATTEKVTVRGFCKENKSE